MQKVTRLLTNAKHDARIEAERRKYRETENAIRRLSTENLMELVYADPSEERIKEIFAAVGGLPLPEGG